MTIDDAIKLLDQAAASISADRKTHAAFHTAVNIVNSAVIDRDNLLRENDSLLERIKWLEAQFDAAQSSPNPETKTATTATK